MLLPFFSLLTAVLVHSVFATNKLVTLGDSYILPEDPWAQDLATELGFELINGGYFDLDQSFFYLRTDSDYPEDRDSLWEGSLLLVTTGGRKIRSSGGRDWSTISASCAGIFADRGFDLFARCDKMEENEITDADWSELEAKAVEGYRVLARDAANAKIRLLGYPRLGNRLWYLPCFMFWPFVSSAEADWLDKQADKFNDVLERAVNTVAAESNVDMEFVSVQDYLTRGACWPYGRHVYQAIISFGSNWLDFPTNLIIDVRTLHPTPAGFGRYIDALKDNLGLS